MIQIIANGIVIKKDSGPTKKSKNIYAVTGTIKPVKEYNIVSDLNSLSIDGPCLLYKVFWKLGPKS